IAELADDHFADQPRSGDAAANRARRQRSGCDAVLAAATSVFGSHMDVRLELGPLEFQLPRDVLADAFHRLAAACALLLLVSQVVLVTHLRQLVPIDLALLSTTAMRRDFHFVRRRRGVAAGRVL